ncbi:type II toxin-antitoxin system VapC family toxin [Bacillus sp. NP157]|nr:type II toxin-antitoxin system VapC family toxin [Bacillus sp. NP157]
MTKKVLVDTGFWIALLTKGDRHHTTALILEEDLATHHLLIPWPTLFEFVDTRLARNASDGERLRKILKRDGNELINDLPYRDSSLDFTLGNRGHTFSLVDHILRSIMEDPEVRIDGFVGFNHGDFHDVCARRNIEMLPD